MAIVTTSRNRDCDLIEYKTDSQESIHRFRRFHSAVVTQAVSFAQLSGDEPYRPVCRDPDDDNILAAAVSANCDCGITGDKDLLVLKAYEGIDILSPRDFLMNEKVD